MIHVYTVRNLINNLISLSFGSQLRNGCKYKIQYYYKKRSGPYWISHNTGNFFCFNSSLSNLYKMSWEQFCLWTNLQNFPIHVIRALCIDVFLYPTLTIQASSRLKRSDNHLWNNSDVCRKKFGEWSLFKSSRCKLFIYCYKTYRHVIIIWLLKYH